MKVSERFYRALDKRLTALEIAKNDQACEIDDIKENSSLHAEAIMETYERLTALEGDGEDNAEVILDHQLRLTALEEKHNHKQIFDRLDVLEKWCDIYTAPMPPSYCEGCADFPCHKPTFNWIQGNPHASCYREKHTCEECKRPWSRQGWDDPNDWVLLCDYETGDNVEYRARNHSQDACSNFEAIQ